LRQIYWRALTMAELAAGEDAGERADGVTSLTSALGTRAHWDAVYEREAANFAADADDEGVDWFAENVGSRLLDWVEARGVAGGVLDVGCGSGVFLCDVAEACGDGRYVGVDNAPGAVALATRVAAKRGVAAAFREGDVERLGALGERFALVLDKGTFDAYMLGAAATVAAYATSVVAALAPGGVLLLTSCNNTADEVEGLLAPFLEPVDRVRYPAFRFGGRTGAAVATVALRAR